MAGRALRETVLYYTPDPQDSAAKLKGVLVRMGIRIRNVAPDQVLEQVGALAGMPGFRLQEERGTALAVIPQKMLVMYRFSSQRMDELLRNLRKAGVPRIDLKAVITESNCQWTFYHLYEEISEEHRQMHGEDTAKMHPVNGNE
ncbi:MAG: DUF3783 domain-containing protein [Lachnospiraceae bacterium]|nr:DUF3783 domain-containing protein [Lachnospiraceae bacterium]